MQKLASLLHSTIAKFAYALHALVEARGGVPDARG